MTKKQRLPRMTRSQIMDRIGLAYTMARATGSSSDDLRAELDRAVFTDLRSKQDAGRARYTADIIGFAEGYSRALYDDIWRSQVEFCYFIDGEWRATAKTRNTARKTIAYIYDTGRAHELTDCKSAHLWVGTDKIFA